MDQGSSSVYLSISSSSRVLGGRGSQRAAQHVVLAVRDLSECESGARVRTRTSRNRSKTCIDHCAVRMRRAVEAGLRISDRGRRGRVYRIYIIFYVYIILYDLFYILFTVPSMMHEAISYRSALAPRPSPVCVSNCETGACLRAIPNK